jgi:hypothetical protein
MNWFQSATFHLAAASGGNPVLSTITIMLFYICFNLVEAQIERLIFGERFEHMLDPIFGACFIAYAAYAVYYCAIFNGSKG